MLSHCKNMVSDPEYRKSYLLGRKTDCRGIIGTFSNYIPEEVIAAAGFHPLRMIGYYETAGNHRKSLFNPVCSFAQDIFTAAQSGVFSYLDHIIFPNSCDSLKVLHQMWQARIRQPSAYCLRHPINTDPASIEYFADQIRVFSDYLKQNGGVDFSKEQLLCTVEKYNQTRGLLRKLYKLRAEKPDCISSADAVAVMTAGLIMDRDEYNDTLKKIFVQVSDQLLYNEIKKRIMIIGPLLDNYELLNKIKQCGSVILHENITNGYRYCDLDVKTDGDLYGQLARRYLLSGPSPTMNRDDNIESQRFQQRLADLNIDGVLFINQKFCEPHVHNYLAKIEILKQMKINFLMLEIEHNTCSINERDLLRIETFLEVAARA